MRIEFLVGKDQQRLAKKIVRRLPTGVRVGEPGVVLDANGVQIGWAIEHPGLDEIDKIRLQYVMDRMAADDPAFTNPDMDDDMKLTAADTKALKNRVDSDPVVAAAERAYRQSLRNALP